ncbi:hypothetical protein JAAARDRAFT_374278 [Jaapia argillacea MUCL 33604]|uniref:RRM domain-containing protein n=1 Tax=Jaapia argillacea MUCL 33604 TaxID=933084 RepID=A0A067QAY6_9AGAM|nr:hypothetical protein JAAARDRAFT_374278 [Jaapia argillacea MUCL 33604]
MPYKPSTTKPRSWGTRFDSLGPSPPASPPTQEVAGDHQASTPPVLQGQPTTPETKRGDERMPHDASIFVGSLPVNVDQHELRSMLSNHLSKHGDIKNVKVVRDGKGSVCAFVQCETASAAANLIHTLQSVPQEPFFGRYLRYERARAFRTLLISYRVPSQVPATLSPHGEAEARSTPDESTLPPIHLPGAMRLWKPLGAKFFNIQYDDDARHCGKHSSSDDPFGGSGVLFSPLSYEAVELHRVAEAFGSVEHFGAYRRDFALNVMKDADSYNGFPYPHNSVRSSKMDPGCWEIKWNHRDDCVNALMTLRRVPYLTVTWAHQPNHVAHDPQFSPTVLQGSRIPQSTAPYPFHAQLHPLEMSPGASTGHTRAHSRRIASQAPPRLRSSTSSSDGTVLSLPSPRHPPGSASDLRKLATGTGFASHAFSPTEHRRMSLPMLMGRGPQGELSGPMSAVDIGDLVSPRAVDWSEQDLPPLSDDAEALLSGNGIWGSKERPGVLRTDTLQPSVDLVPMRLPLRLAHQQISSGGSVGSEDDPQSSLPTTPEFDSISITPKTPGYSIPQTPLSDSLELSTPQVGSRDSTHFGSFSSVGSFEESKLVREREVDPTTIFVGGLEMYGPNAWDEQKVRTLFTRFGGIEDVKFVRPLNKKASFAFVRFNNTDAPARAVLEEHNRVYEGRHIRVQLRDIHPSARSPGLFRFGGRGRGRYQHSSSSRSFGSFGSLSTSSSLGLSVTPMMPNGQVVYEVGVPLAVSNPSLGASSDQGSGVFSRSHRTEGHLQCKVIAGHGSGAFATTSEVQFPTIQPSTSQPYATERRCFPDSSSSSSLTPPPSSSGSSVSSAGQMHPYPMQAMGYYPPHPWMMFGHPYPYPYAPNYSGFVMPGQQPPQPYAVGPTSEWSAQNHASNNPWVSSSGAYKVSHFKFFDIVSDPSQTSPSIPGIPSLPTAISAKQTSLNSSRFNPRTFPSSTGYLWGRRIPKSPPRWIRKFRRRKPRHSGHQFGHRTRSRCPIRTTFPSILNKPPTTTTELLPRTGVDGL